MTFPEMDTLPSPRDRVERHILRCARQHIIFSITGQSVSVSSYSYIFAPIARLCQEQMTESVKRSYEVTH